ncbi:MAG: hypothetical protein M5R36_24335 [Deltaproteobacteria bacterium]|nr:hypothetical protein [Deltaproteobacteria bacterium]
MQTGEFELPMVLVDGLAKPWANDLRLFIGEYAYLGSPNAQGPGLEIRTHYANIAFSPDADVRFSITGEGSLLTVNAGQITITHDAQPAPVGVPAGNRVRITGSGIRLMKVPSRSLAMSR